MNDTIQESLLMLTLRGGINLVDWIGHVDWSCDQLVDWLCMDWSCDQLVDWLCVDWSCDQLVDWSCGLVM